MRLAIPPRALPRWWPGGPLVAYFVPGDSAFAMQAGGTPVVIKLDGAGLAHADLSGSTISAEGKPAQTIDFRGANLTNADLSGSDLEAEGMEATIGFVDHPLSAVARP